MPGPVKPDVIHVYIRVVKEAHRLFPVEGDGLAVAQVVFRDVKQGCVIFAEGQDTPGIIIQRQVVAFQDGIQPYLYLPGIFILPAKSRLANDWQP